MTNMNYKSFYRHLLQEEYPLGGFQMSKSEADVLNTNITDENIFKMMAMAKSYAKKPLATPRKDTPHTPAQTIKPEPKTYTVPTTVSKSPLSATEFRQMLAKRNAPEVEEGMGDDAAKSVKDYLRIRRAISDKGYGEQGKFQKKLDYLKTAGALSNQKKLNTTGTFSEETHTLQEWAEILNRPSK